MAEHAKAKVLDSTAAVKDVTIVDTKGRRILLRKPNVIQQYRMVEIIGESAKNEVYMGMILPMIYIHAIDDQVVMISTKRELEALIERLDDDVTVVIQALQENFAIGTAEEQKEKIKK